MAEWYRHTTWSQEDESGFFNKLKRARKDNRAQYLRIQAVNLFRMHDRHLLPVAERLACKVIADYQDAKIEIASTYDLLGKIYEELGETDRAILHYQKALEAEKNYPNVTTDAYIHYAEIVIKAWRVDRFNEIIKILNKRVSKASFPIARYKAYIIMAIICKHEQNAVDYEKYLSLAKQNADMKTSGFRYHKNLGLVTETDRWLETVLQE